MMSEKEQKPTSFFHKIKPAFWSLKARLMLLISVVLILVVGMPVGLFVYQMDLNYKEFSTNMIEITTQIVYQFIYDGMMSNDREAIQRHLELLAMEPTIELVRIYKPTGEIVYSSKEEEIKKNVFELTGDVFFRQNNRHFETFEKKGELYSHHHPIYIQKECTGCHVNQEGKVAGIMDVHAGFTDSEQLYASAKKLSIFGGVLIIGLLWLITNLLYQGQIGSRLRLINQGFDELSRGNFNFKVKMPGRHELALLADKFNEAAGKIKQAHEREEQFYLETLKRADRLVTLGEVAAEIAHEVNNPAGIILTRTEIIKDEMAEKCPTCPVQKDLDIVIQQTEKIAETTRSILHYARKLPQSFSATDLNEVVRHSLKIMDARIKKRNVHVQLKLEERPAVVWGNFNQLEQVFCNLLNNSLDVLPEKDGRIIIEIVSRQRQKPHYRIAFYDNGPGIPEEYRELIFSPFFTTKEQGKGTGLGLFIVRNIIGNHKGSIKLRKKSGMGACFIMELERYDGTT